MTDNKRRGWLREYYGLSFDFIKESRHFIYLAIAIFFFFAIIGFFVPVSENVSNQILQFIDELLKKTENLQHYDLIKFIFLNNIQSSFLAMILGLFFGVYPMITLVINGYILGFISVLSVNSEGIIILWRLLPHGIFELPAIFISAGLGFRMATFFLEKEKLETLKIYIKKSIITFVLVVIPLLVIAAFIEGTLISLAG